MQSTVCGRVKDTSLYPVLDATSSLMDKVERLYFKERYIKHADRNGLKRLLLKQYCLSVTARLAPVSQQSSNSARGIPLSTAAGPSPAMDGSPGYREKCSGGSQQHCSAGVCECSTILEPF